jgi:hypothetical protein
MSFRWPNKDPDEVLDYSIDWSRFLASATISSVTWYVNDASNAKTLLTATGTVNTLSSTAQTISSDNKTATIYLANGTNNVQYQLYCQITDNTGNTAERTVKIKVRDK